MNFTIRNATSDDANLLAALGTTTCYEAYVELDPSRDLADYCAMAFSTEQMSAELTDINSTFLIGEVNGNAVAYAKLREGKAVDCMSGLHAIEVQRIYFLDRYKGNGLGVRVMHRCFEIAREKGYEAVWLGVWEKNLAAQRFYEKLGMTVTGKADFSDGKSVFINLVYAKDIAQ